jgi:two-component SAPR family response regulator
MKAFLIDDEFPCVEELAFLLRQYPDIEITGRFTDPLKALEAVSGRRPDVVFLDIDMPRLDGLELALKIQAICAGVCVIFVTAYSRYALDAFKAYPLDYLLKPIKQARLDAAVEHLRRQYTLIHPASVDRGFKIKCFGRFQIITDKEIKWGTRRVRDLFLYLVDRCGAAPTKSELIEAVFGTVDDSKSANNMYVTIYKLRSLLDTLDNERRYIQMDGDYALSIAPGVCDYTDFMRFARLNAAVSSKNAVEAARALNLCSGIYLEGEDYGWVSETSNLIDVEYERIALGLAGHYASAHLEREAENVINTLLARNPLSEEGFTTLLDLYMKNANREAFSARYEEYARMLKNEVGTKPAGLYQDYYKSLKH